jgi:thioredoxin:protein disulfide reductase
MKDALRTFGLCLGLSSLVLAQAPAVAALSPFIVHAALVASNAVPRVIFQFEVPSDHVLYADRLVFETEDGKALTPAILPEPAMHRNELTGQERKAYDKPFSVELDLAMQPPVNLLVKFQGCSNSACYFPERHYFTVTSTGVAVNTEAPAGATTLAAGESPAVNGAVTLPDTNGFRVVARETGYMPKKSFLAFLDRASSGKAAAATEPVARFNELGPMLSLLLIVLGGVGLNLTPCVLPLIPINLAIIGAGARASSRRRGFALGGVYGVGMALVYGVLGLVVVLTGAKFGALNSSAWFNLGIAVVFGFMAVAMFDLITVDFSRFQRGSGAPGKSQKGQFVLALGMGVMAALLAGACVAPVVISVLLLAAHLYAKGIMAGLLLPFLLGLGMALPWPFAGAGLSFLPKPGKWMKWVKYSFGVLILLFAAYYGHLAIDLFRPGRALGVMARTPAGDQSATVTPEAALASVIQQARSQGRPVLIDFAASWCKNCAAMDATVFSNPEVKERLKDFVVIRYDAEKPNDSPAREVLNRFGVMGLPTYVVLKLDQ